MNNNKLKTIAFTGHRMNRIRIEKQELSGLITAAVIYFYLKGYKVFLTGMAEGLDLIAAEEVLKIKEHYPDIELHCIIPFAGQSDRMNPEDKLRYNAILSAADYEIYLSEKYYDGCFLRRNDYLVDNSTQLIAYYDNVPKGGTYYTVKNALRKGLEVFNLFNREMEYHHFYQDELLKGWGRSLFNVKAISYEQAVESIRLLHFQDVYDLEDHPLIAYDSFEYLLEANTRVSLRENEGQATIEYFKCDSLKTSILTNADDIIAESKQNTIRKLASQLAEKELTDVFKMLPDEFCDKNNPGKYAEVYQKKYDEYFKSYMEQLSKL
ncbi:SLOG family protein [Dysgonomonas termitidis]|uniref:SLOG family protein n=1 Tax=Dysgonomonas termitidis TaxID=1516126 RepID=A0ABV9L0Z4_9BACT